MLPIHALLAAMPPVAVSRFDNMKDFEGWNCGKITTCGDLGHVCGGYDIKGKKSDINKVFKLPQGMYSVELDFIKIDSWLVRACVCTCAPCEILLGSNLLQTTKAYILCIHGNSFDGPT